MVLLLVEDDEMTSHAMKQLLRRIGIKCRIAPTAVSALEELVKLPDLVVLDLMLADGSGLEVLEAIRETGLKSRVAVITEPSDPETRQSIERLHPSATFSKPLNFDEFGSWLCDMFP